MSGQQRSARDRRFAPDPCPDCEGDMVPFSKRGDGSIRWVCAAEGFGASCRGEIVEKKDGTLLVGGDGYA